MPIITSGFWDGGLVCILTTSLIIDGTIKNLPNIPDNAKSALLVLEKDISFVVPANNTILARFTEDNITIPTITIGMPLVNLSIYEVTEPDLKRFQITITQGTTHTLRIQYYG